jgi:hypothetical protein
LISDFRFQVADQLPMVDRLIREPIKTSKIYN